MISHDLLDSEEYGGSNTRNEDISENKNVKAKTIEELKVNYFKLKDEEESVMQELNIKLNVGYFNTIQFLYNIFFLIVRIY